RSGRLSLHAQLLRSAILTFVAGLAIGIVMATPLRAEEATVSESELSALQRSASSALDRINAYRALAGVAPAASHPALMRSAAGHVAYYDLNRSDPSLAGMGLHDERADAAGFSGVSMGDRARAAGYASAA